MLFESKFTNYWGDKAHRNEHFVSLQYMAVSDDLVMDLMESAFHLSTYMHY